MSSTIHELFGFPLEDNGPESKRHRKACLCPFMGQLCDGGGNRYQSFLHLNADKDRELVSFFEGRAEDIPPGLCSLRTSRKVWIVCPRRLFVLGRDGDHTPHERFSEELLRHYSPIAKQSRCGVWSEVKIKYAAESAEGDEESEKLFDYTFDYIVCPTAPKPLSDVSESMKCTIKKLEASLEANGYTLASRHGIKYLEDYPAGIPLIIEVMTSSTSGGNKSKGTTIESAFRKAILKKPHEAPGINYRQVWARMVSQLIVKSQIGKAWGGRTIWILQDSLTDYISNTTDLNLRKLISKALKEVNILSLKYSRDKKDRLGSHLLEVEHLYAGSIPPIHGDTDFNKLLQAASIPTKLLLEKKLLNKRPRTFISI